jgi:hypothetical protein
MNDCFNAHTRNLRLNLCAPRWCDAGHARSSSGMHNGSSAYWLQSLSFVTPDRAGCCCRRCCKLQRKLLPRPTLRRADLPSVAAAVSTINVGIS